MLASGALASASLTCARPQCDLIISHGFSCENQPPCGVSLVESLSPPRESGPPLCRRPRLFVPEVEVELGRSRSKLAQRPRLELSHALARDAELPPDLLEGLRRLARQSEPAVEDFPQPLLEAGKCFGKLDRAEIVGHSRLGTLGRLVLDQVGVHAVAFSDRGLEADRVLDELEELLDPRFG